MNSIFTPETMLGVKHDSLKFGMLFIVARILMTQTWSPLHEKYIPNPIFAPNNPLLNTKDWAISALLVIVGFATYWLIVRKVIREEQFVSGDLRVALNTILYFGTMLVVSRLLARRPLNQEWMKSALYMILGFISYDVVVRKFVKPAIDTKAGRVINDTLRWTVMFALATWLADRHYDRFFYKELFSVLIGLGLFNAVVVNYV